MTYSITCIFSYNNDDFLMIKKLLGLLVLLLLLGIGGFFAGKQWLASYVQTPLSIKEDTVFTLPAGTGRVGLQQLLAQQGIVSNTTALPYLFKMSPELAKFKAGTYRLSPEMTIEDLLLLLKSGREAQFSIRFIEGTRMQDWLVVIAQAPHLEKTLAGLSSEQIAERFGISDPTHPEGWFAPDTYMYTAGMTDKALLQRAFNRMKSTLDSAWQGRDANLPYTTAYEMLIMASIIEKETAIEAERTKVSSVFVNRLRKGMRLQTDPTVIYGMGSKYNNRITRKDLTTPTPYNTYVISGLPPTPIAMPSIASINAAAHPAQTPYYYFVATGNGGHTFSTHLQDHNKAVRDYVQTIRTQRAAQEK